MNWTRFVLTAALSGLVSSMTDWLFAGVLFRDKYMATPELWRNKPGQAEMRSIVYSTALGLVSCSAFLYLCIGAGALSTVASALGIALIAWLAAPLPLIFTNVIWIRMHPLLGVSHSLGWLARFVITALFGLWLL